MPIGPAIPGRKLEKGGALPKSGRMKRLRESKEGEGMVLTDYLGFLSADFSDYTEGYWKNGKNFNAKAQRYQDAKIVVSNDRQTHIMQPRWQILIPLCDFASWRLCVYFRWKPSIWSATFGFKVEVSLGGFRPPRERDQPIWKSAGSSRCTQSTDFCWILTSLFVFRYSASPPLSYY